MQVSSLDWMRGLLTERLLTDRWGYWGGYWLTEGIIDWLTHKQWLTEGGRQGGTAVVATHRRSGRGRGHVCFGLTVRLRLWLGITLVVIAERNETQNGITLVLIAEKIKTHNSHIFVLTAERKRQTVMQADATNQKKAPSIMGWEPRRAIISPQNKCFQGLVS